MAKTLTKSIALMIITDADHQMTPGIAALRMGISGVTKSRLIESTLKHMDEEGNVEFKRDQYGSYDDVDQEEEHNMYARIYAACNQDWKSEEHDIDAEDVANDFDNSVQYKIGSNRPTSGAVQSDADLMFGGMTPIETKMALEKKVRADRYFNNKDRLVTYCTEIVINSDPMVTDEPDYVGEYLLSRSKNKDAKDGINVIDFVMSRTKLRFIEEKEASKEGPNATFDEAKWDRAAEALKLIKVSVS